MSRARVTAWLSRNNLTLGAAAAALLLIVLFLMAFADFVGIAKRKDQQIQESALRGQLVEFLLMTTREPDGSTLLDNPGEFGRARRASQVVNIRRSFFSYFLTKGNMRTFRTESVRFEPPRACVLEFPIKAEVSGFEQDQVLRACFAAVPSDPTGRYVYFMLRYPASSIETHRRGSPVTDADRVVLRFVGEKKVSILLSFEPPPMVARIKKPVARRFDGLYEMSAFLPDEGNRPIKAVNAQAIARSEEGVQYATVTLLGRIDSAILPGGADFSAWPSSGIKSMHIGVEISRADSNRLIGFRPGAAGTALVSLEQAYFAAIQSRARLAVYSGNVISADKKLWESTGMDGGHAGVSPGWFQSIGNRIAAAVVAGTKSAEAIQRHQGEGFTPITAMLTTEGIAVPDIAARALAWLVAALIAIAILGLSLLGLFRRLERLTRTAYAVARAHHGTGFEEYAHSRDQIGTLGRVIHLLYKRHRERIGRHKRRLEREAVAVRRRHDNLRAIGHEIKSPLANLFASLKPGTKEYRELERMRRTIEALYEASRIEDGLRNGIIVPKRDDVAAYLATFAENSRIAGVPVAYVGPQTGVDAVFDDMGLDQVIETLIENARRYMSAGTDIEIRLRDANTGGTIIEVFNSGSRVDDTERIFELGVTDRSSESNLGLGLYSARIQIEAAGGTIHAENRPGGFAIVITLRSGRASPR